MRQQGVTVRLGLLTVTCLLVVGCTNVLVVPSARPTAAFAAPATVVSPSPSLLAPTPVATAGAWPDRPQGATESASLVRVVDGDTIRAVVDGVEQRIRYIGMDTPESAAPGTPVEPFSLEATRGYAQVATYPPDVRYADVFLAAQREAREAADRKRPWP